MPIAPFKYLTVRQVREYLRVADAGGNSLLVIENLSGGAKDELECLGLYGQSENNVDFNWHLEHITMGGYHAGWTNVDVRRAMRKLGLADAL